MAWHGDPGNLEERSNDRYLKLGYKFCIHVLVIMAKNSLPYLISTLIIKLV